jgi:hypothetical protein
MGLHRHTSMYSNDGGQFGAVTLREGESSVPIGHRSTLSTKKGRVEQYTLIDHNYENSQTRVYKFYEGDDKPLLDELKALRLCGDRRITQPVFQRCRDNRYTVTINGKVFKGGEVPHEDGDSLQAKIDVIVEKKENPIGRVFQKGTAHKKAENIIGLFKSALRAYGELPVLPVAFSADKVLFSGERIIPIGLSQYCKKNGKGVLYARQFFHSFHASLYSSLERVVDKDSQSLLSQLGKYFDKDMLSGKHICEEDMFDYYDRKLDELVINGFAVRGEAAHAGADKMKDKIWAQVQERQNFLVDFIAVYRDKFVGNEGSALLSNIESFTKRCPPGRPQRCANTEYLERKSAQFLYQLASNPQIIGGHSDAVLYRKGGEKSLSEMKVWEVGLIAASLLGLIALLVLYVLENAKTNREQLVGKKVKKSVLVQASLDEKAHLHEEGERSVCLQAMEMRCRQQPSGGATKKSPPPKVPSRPRPVSPDRRKVNYMQRVAFHRNNIRNSRLRREGKRSGRLTADEYANQLREQDDQRNRAQP